MICPKCGVSLAKELFQNQEIDVCPSCYGIWSPTNKIGLYIRLLTESGYRIEPLASEPTSENRGWICDAPSSFAEHAGNSNTIGRPIANKYSETVIDSATTPIANNYSKSAALIASTCSEPAAPTVDNCLEPTIPVCPSCKLEMNPFIYDPDSTITLDECKSCRSVWIDADMISALAEYLSLSLKHPIQMQKQISSPTLEQTNENINGQEQALEAFYRNVKPAYEETIEIPLIRRILGIPCVERNLSMTPWATIIIIAINVFLFLMVILSPTDIRAIYDKLGFMPARITTEPLTAFFSFFTAIFMHADLGHLFGNMMFLWLFGGRIEEDYGTKTFIAVYMIAGIVAGLSHTVTNLSSIIPAIGASGAISGILGAFFILHPKNRVITYFMLIPIPMSAALYLGFWFSIQILNSLLTAAAGGAGIAWFAHIGGFVAGAAMAYPLKKQVELVAQEQQKIAA